MTQSKNVSEDLIISILEEVFQEEIDLTTLTLPREGLSKCKCNAINYFKRYLCHKERITCHYVSNNSCKYPTLKKRIDRLWEENKREANNQEMTTFRIPDKSEITKPFEKTTIIDPMFARHAEMVERINMEQEDHRLIFLEKCPEIEKKKGQFIESIRELKDAESAPAPTTVGKEDIIAIAASYSFYHYDEMYELLFEMFDILNDIRGCQEAKMNCKIRYGNRKAREEIEEATSYNEKEKIKYERLINRIKEQKAMREEEEASLRFDIMSKRQDLISSIRSHNEMETNRYRRELEVLTKWKKDKSLLESSIEHPETAVEMKEFVVRTTGLEWIHTSDLDVIAFLKIFYEGTPGRPPCPYRNSVIAAAKKYGYPYEYAVHLYSRYFLKEEGDRKNWIQTIGNPVLDAVYFRARAARLIFLMENGDISLEGVSFAQTQAILDRHGFSPIMTNYVIRLKQGIYGKNLTSVHKRYVAKQEALLEKEFGTPPTVNRPFLKKEPEPMREATVDRLVYEKMGEAVFSSRKKLKQKIVPALVDTLDYEVPPVEEMDFMALICGLIHSVEDGQAGKLKAIEFFGGFPKFRWYSFVNRNKSLINQLRPYFTMLLNDWYLGINYKNLLQRSLKSLRVSHVQYELNRMEKKREEKIKTPKIPKPYQIFKKICLIETEADNIEKRKRESLRISNEFHSLEMQGLELNPVRPGQKKKAASEVVAEEEPIMQFVEENVIRRPFTNPVLSRFKIRQEARKVISHVGSAALRSVPTHLIENVIFATAQLKFCPKLDINKQDHHKFYKRKGRVSFARSIRPVRIR